MTAPARSSYSPDFIRIALKRLPYQSVLKSHAFDANMRPRARRDRNPAEEVWCSDADIVSALRELPERRRRSIVGNVVYGRPARQVAAELGVTQQTVSRDCQVGIEAMAVALGWSEPPPLR